MSLREKISADLKDAMKAREKEITSVLRMILSELKYAQTAGEAREELSDDVVAKVISNYYKRLEKSIDDFPDGPKRLEIRSEMAIVAKYLPQKADRHQVEQVVERVVAATPERNFGKLMKLCLAELGSQGDGKVVSEVLKQKLGGDS